MSNKNGKSFAIRISQDDLIRVAVIAFIFCLIYVGYAYAGDFIKYGSKPTPTPTKASAATNTPTTIAKKIPTSVVNRVQKSTSPTTNPDPPVHCKINDNCGGGTKPLKKSECDNFGCCQTKDGWEFLSKVECDKLHDQYDLELSKNKQRNEQQQSRVAVYLGGLTYYCDVSAENAIKDAYSTYTKQYESARELGSMACKSVFNPSDTSAYTKCYQGWLNSVGFFEKAYQDLITTHCT